MTNPADQVFWQGGSIFSGAEGNSFPTVQSLSSVSNVSSNQQYDTVEELQKTLGRLAGEFEVANQRFRAAKDPAERSRILQQMEQLQKQISENNFRLEAAANGEPLQTNQPLPPTYQPQPLPPDYQRWLQQSRSGDPSQVAEAARSVIHDILGPNTTDASPQERAEEAMMEASRRADSITSEMADLSRKSKLSNEDIARLKVLEAELNKLITAMNIIAKALSTPSQLRA